MASANFYHIYIIPRLGITKEQVQKVMDNAIDWYRYDDKCWFLYTTSDAQQWHSRFKEFVEPGGHIIITKMDISDYWGFFDKRLWEWIKKAR